MPAGASHFDGKACYGVARETDLSWRDLWPSWIRPSRRPAALRALQEQGVAVKVLTGDNDVVTRKVCRELGLEVGEVLLGRELEGMDNQELAQRAERCNLFAKLSPAQKARIVGVLRSGGHTVGFMGDASTTALRNADVGISVDSASDIAKEAADIIMLEKDLMSSRAHPGRAQHLRQHYQISENDGQLQLRQRLFRSLASAFLPFCRCCRSNCSPEPAL